MLLVTGHRGFVGKHLCSYLKSKHENFVGYDLLDGYDIRDIHQLDKFFDENQITEVIHLAALAGVRRGQEYPEEYINTNIIGTLNVVRMCEKYNVSHLIHYSSSSVYGDTTPPIREDFTKKPKSIYGITKLASEYIVQSSHIKQTTIVIPFTIYGEDGRRDGVIYRWLEQIKNNKPITVYGNGKSERGYVHVEDIVAITYNILYSYYCWQHEIFNIGGSEVIKLEQILKVFRDEVKDLQVKEMEMPKSDICRNYADTSKARNHLGFEPKPMFEKNLKRIIKKEL